MRITINAGHSEVDPGAIGPSGLQEALVNRQVSIKVCALLNYFGHRTQLVQSDSLQEICELSNTWESDIFISIHCNAAENPSAHGTETFYCEGSTKGSGLAQYIHCELVGLGLANRGTKNNPLYVTKHTDAPACLVEIAFISNAEEEAMLSDVNMQYTFAEAICRGIQNFCKEA